MNNLTVVTHTMTSWGRDISKCVESVRAALPPGANHMVIDLDTYAGDFNHARYDALSLNEYVAFVDDDDYISPESLTLCLEAITNAHAGIAFTDEVVVLADGRNHVNSGTINYNKISISPHSIHHLSLIRSSAVSKDALDIAVEFGSGIEWLIKSSAAMNGGAIHVPIAGYYWIQHDGQYHRTPAVQQQYKDNIRRIGNKIREWQSDKNRNGIIPTYTRP